MTVPEEYREAIGDALDRVAELVVRHLEDRQRLSRNAAAAWTGSTGKVRLG